MPSYLKLTEYTDATILVNMDLVRKIVRYAAAQVTDLHCGPDPKRDVIHVKETPDQIWEALNRMD